MYPSMDKWISKTRFIRAGEYESGSKRKETLTSWMNTEDIILSEIRQKRQIQYDSIYMKYLQESKSSRQ